jgi:glutamine amidotransferase
MMIAIIDYGMGNLRSVQKGLAVAGYQAVITSDPGMVTGADGVVLPGVGAFRDAMTNLQTAGLDEALRLAVAAGKPVLGICLGMQLLFSSSEEWGETRGLDLIPGRVRRFTGVMKIPHMGWNQVNFRGDCPLFAGIPDHSYFYFIHSYYVDSPDREIACGVTDYGIDFTSAVARGNLFGVQFHPEKSSLIGSHVLANFGKLVDAV